ncbi:MAG: response regulator transcription factor [Pedobacter sp.]|nr:MAG: response regulator transcription factor [Pedobacter sp.]
MIRCALVDDKPLALDVLVDHIAKMPDLKVVISTTNPLDALKEVMDGAVDLVFLDIQMPELSGLQFMKITQGKCKVILTTAYSEFALEGFEHDAVDYLLKPVSFERFYKAVTKARHYLDVPTKSVTPPQANIQQAKPFIFVKTEYRLVKIAVDDILYIEGMQNYVALHTATGKILSLLNIKKLEEMLGGNGFLRVHRSYLVSLGKIESIERSRIYIGEAIIPLGDSFRDAFFNAVEGR